MVLNNNTTSPEVLFQDSVLGPQKARGNEYLTGLSYNEKLHCKYSFCRSLTLPCRFENNTKLLPTIQGLAIILIDVKTKYRFLVIDMTLPETWDHLNDVRLALRSAGSFAALFLLLFYFL